MPSLSDSADANFLVHAAWAQRRLAGMRVIRSGVTLVDSGLPCDTFNCILAARLTVGIADAAIDGALAHFRAAGRPFSWWVGPADRPSDLGTRLEAAGLRRAEAELAMSVRIEAALAAASPPPSELTVERVATRSQLAEFAAVNAANWTPPDENVVRFYALAAASLLSAASPLRYFVGRVAGAPVATVELATGGGVAGIYNVATVEASRRRRYASAMIVRALEDARAEGLRTAVLQAAPDAVGIYRRLGFKEFGTITEYKPGGQP